MKITKHIPEKEYPYLAVWAGTDEVLSESEIRKIENETIVLISLIFDNKVYVQHLFGGKEGYLTNHEEEYSPLPKGYSITITQ